jgi:hypothetical protein
MNKNGVTMTGIIVTILIVLALFFGMYNYAVTNFNSAGIEYDSIHDTSYDTIQESMGDLNSSVEGIKSAAEDITQADAGIALVAWNGLVGIAQTLKLTFNLFDISINVFNAIFPALELLPPWFNVLFQIGIIAVLTWVIIGLFKGEQKT